MPNRSAIPATIRRRKHQGSIGFLITGDEEGPAINGTEKLLRWAYEKGEQFDHCIVGERTSADVLGDTIKIGRRGCLNATLVVEGRQGHSAYPERADNPIPKLLRLTNALIAARLDSGTAHFDASNLEIVYQSTLATPRSTSFRRKHVHVSTYASRIHGRLRRLRRSCGAGWTPWGRNSRSNRSLQCPGLFDKAQLLHNARH